MDQEYWLNISGNQHRIKKYARTKEMKWEGMHLAATDDSAASNAFWTFGVAVKDGKLDELKGLIQEMSDASQANEPGTLIYEWTISQMTTKNCRVHERYANSWDAALRHLASCKATSKKLLIRV